MKLGFALPIVGSAVSSAAGLSAFCRGLEDLGYDTLWVDPFGSLNDTTVTLTMHRHSTPVLDPAPSGRLRLAAWPNPARGDVVLGFSAPPGKAELTIVDLAGRRVATLFDGAAAGPHEARWNGRAVDGRPLPSGVYLVRLAAGGEVKTRRLVLLE